ncbi:MAG: hypothetical protein CMH55_04375 [Myxococcales bacterium]|nr:hypothetical protein [Myxococcales bacterium]
MRVWLVWLAFVPGLAEATPHVGLELGIGRLDERLRLHIQPDLILKSEGQHLHLAVPLEFFPGELSLRRQDWDTAGDFTAILQDLKWRRGKLSASGGKLHLSAGAETVVQQYPIGHHPDRPDSALQFIGQNDRWRGQVALSRHFALASLAYSLWTPRVRQPVQPELALVVAGTDAGPLQPGVDGRLAIDLTLPYHGSDFALAGFASGVLGLGSHQDRQWRVHGGLRGEHRLSPDWLRWRLELRHSPSGLVAQPFDPSLGMLDPLTDLTLGPTGGLGFAAKVQWSDRMRLTFSQDPGLQRAEAVASIHRGKVGRIYLGGGWVGDRSHPFALAEVRWRLQRGATVFARARLLERSVEGGQPKAVTDGMLGISWALALQPGD